MRNALQLLKRFGKDEEGAALVEYTVLLGVMLVAVIGTIVLVGGWVNTKWAALWTALSSNYATGSSRASLVGTLVGATMATSRSCGLASRTGEP
jgi:pilus assembly protein Flp/PilA